MLGSVKRGSMVTINYYRTDDDLYGRKPFKSIEHKVGNSRGIITKCVNGIKETEDCRVIDVVREDGLVAFEFIDCERRVEMYITKEDDEKYRRVYDCLMGVVASYLCGRGKDVSVDSIDFVESKVKGEIGLFSFYEPKMGRVCFGITSDLKIRDSDSSIEFLDDSYPDLKKVYY